MTRGVVRRPWIDATSVLSVGTRGRCVLLVGVWLAVGPVPAVGGQTPPPGFYLTGGAVAGANPTVAGAFVTAGWVEPFYRQRRGVLWESARIEPRVTAVVNPSFADLVGEVYVEPVAPVDVTLGAGVRRYIDQFGFGLAALDSYADRGPTAASRSYDGEVAQAAFASLAPRLKAAFGPILVANTLFVGWYRHTMTDARFVEEPISLAVLARGDVVVRNGLDLLYRNVSRAVEFAAVGAQYQVVTVPDAPRSDQPASHRLGVVGIASDRFRRAGEWQLVVGSGLYLNGEPIAVDRPYAFVLATTTWRRSRADQR